MNTPSYLISEAARLEHLASEPVGFFAQNVVKKAWPTEVGESYSRVVPTLKDINLALGSAVAGRTVYTYQLEHSALESASFPLRSIGEALASKREREDNFLTCVGQLWENKFRDSILRLTKNRVVVRWSDTSHGALGQRLVDLGDSGAPRTSLFGRPVLPYRTVSDKNGVYLVVNKKYVRCPEQFLSFDPDAVHFLFLDPSTWGGKVVYRERYEGAEGFFRLTATVAAKPHAPYLSKLFTVLPKGFRGLLFRAVWALLRIKP